MQPPEIVELAVLTDELRRRRRDGQRVTLVHGPFDDAERIDRALLRAVRAHSDVIIATVPAQDTERDRLALAASIAEIDFVVPVHWTSAAMPIVLIEPDVYAFSSSDDEGPTHEELDALAKTGAELYTLSRRGDAVIEWRQRPEPGSRERRRFAASLADRVGMADLTAGLDAIRRLKVAVVGETIIDEYAYCDAIGKSGKEPIIVNRFLSCDAQGGGVLAVANHLADFCHHVEIVSALGSVDRREEFVRSTLRPGVAATFVTKTGSPTIVKRRYIDAYSRAKMMGVYHMDMSPLAGDDESAFVTALEGALSRCDVVIVADYGHGLIGRRAVETLSDRSQFLAVNTQLNAANAGYHVLSKYPRADFACLHEGELRMDARDLRADLPALLESTALRMNARSVMATQGKSGTALFTRHRGVFRCPALATTVVERIGAGDAVLALSSVATAAGLAPELVSVLGNLAGAQMVAVMGNSASIRKARLVESIRHLLASAPAEEVVS
ncbi:MAG TPA: PfkB family carbohydrate kinase [Nannocystaceae bacterium]|nr:PfkB family carbohydrate kinase [Nannocystaceae bacterium]